MTPVKNVSQVKHPEWWRRGKVYSYGPKWWTSRINTSGAYEATVGNISLPGWTTTANLNFVCNHFGYDCLLSVKLLSAEGEEKKACRNNGGYEALLELLCGHFPCLFFSLTFWFNLTCSVSKAWKKKRSYILYNVVVPIFTLFPLSPLLVSASELSGNVQRPFGIPNEINTRMSSASVGRELQVIKSASDYTCASKCNSFS